MSSFLNELLDPYVITMLLIPIVAMAFVLGGLYWKYR